jgi:hypothetical protein
LTVVAALAVTTVLSGCTSSEDLTADLPTQNEAQWTLPLDDFLPGNSHLPDYADALVIQDCLAAEGFNWPVPWQDVEDTGSVSRNSAYRRLFSETFAAQYGYHLAPWSSPSADSWREFVAVAAGMAEQPGFEDAYGKCREDGRAELPAVDSETQDYGTSLASSTYDQARLADAVMAAAAKWRECLSTAGLSELPDSPENMPPPSENEQWKVLDNSTTAGAEEIRIASADAACRTSTGYSTVMYQTEWDLQVEALKTHADTLNRVRSGLKLQREKILAVIAAHAPAQ